MNETMTAIETTGIIDENRHLRVEQELPITGPRRVRVLVLALDDDEDERQWLRNASSNSAFAFLREPREDIYTLKDGAASH